MNNLAENRDILQVLTQNRKEVLQDSDVTTEKQIVKLQEELSSERSSRKTERFAWIMAGSILLDCLILPPLTSGLCIFVTALQLVLLLTLSTAYELKTPTILLRKLWEKLGLD